jgi:hypothetical protein
MHFGVTRLGVETAGSSNPKAGPEGQLVGLKNAEAFRDRLFAARDALLANGSAPPPSVEGTASFASAPLVQHSMQYGSGSPELQQLQEINAGIKQARCPHLTLKHLLSHRRFCLLAGYVHSDTYAAVAGAAASDRKVRRRHLWFLANCQ